MQNVKVRSLQEGKSQFISQFKTTFRKCSLKKPDSRDFKFDPRLN